MSLFRRSQQSPEPRTDAGSTIRELLYGDVPLAAWRAQPTDDLSRQFQMAAATLRSGDSSATRQILEPIAANEHLDSRDRLEAWATLRELGVNPPQSVASLVLGLVIDVPMSAGLDTLAAYADGSARYVNQSGALAIVEPTSPLSARVLELVDAGQQLALLIGPWDGNRPPLRPDHARISMLCPGGLYFGDGPVNEIMQDPIAEPVFRCGAQLVGALAEASSR